MTAPESRSLVRPEPKQHWLVRPENIRRLWWVFGIVLGLTVAAQTAIEVHAYFGVDGMFGFSALFGFLSCVAMVLFAKIMGWWLKRPDDYYPEEGLFLWTEGPESAPGQPDVAERHV